MNIFESVFATDLISRPVMFFACIGTALIIGVFFAFVYSIGTRHTQSFTIALAMLPAVVCAVIMSVNGNIGAGIAVAGAFSLVRFRSAQGSAREISAIFLAMGAGLVCGMGHIAYATAFALILGVLMAVYTAFLNRQEEKSGERILKITVPEDLNYSEELWEVLDKYTKKAERISVRSTNMGSMFRLTYSVRLRDISLEKEFIDALRTKNGNLEIGIYKCGTGENEL